MSTKHQGLLTLWLVGSQDSADHTDINVALLDVGLGLRKKEH